jgi:hypothetical protein
MLSSKVRESREFLLEDELKQARIELSNCVQHHADCERMLSNAKKLRPEKPER